MEENVFVIENIMYQKSVQMNNCGVYMALIKKTYEEKRIVKIGSTPKRVKSTDTDGLVVNVAFIPTLHYLPLKKKILMTFTANKVPRNDEGREKTFRDLLVLNDAFASLKELFQFAVKENQVMVENEMKMVTDMLESLDVE